MLVRLALESDFDTIIAMGAANVAETCPGEDYDPKIAAATLQRYLDTADPTFFVCEDKGRVIGFLQAYMFAYDHRDGLFTVQKVLYVSPENRGSRASSLLIRELIRWSIQLGADRIEGGNDNSFQSERTARFLSHFGFEMVGFAMRKRLEEGGHGR